VKDLNEEEVGIQVDVAVSLDMGVQDFQQGGLTGRDDFVGGSEGAKEPRVKAEVDEGGEDLG
jgi:hypothetical protein